MQRERERERERKEEEEEEEENMACARDRFCSGGQSSVDYENTKINPSMY